MLLLQLLLQLSHHSQLQQADKTKKSRKKPQEIEHLTPTQLNGCHPEASD
jgi:hypothetical protein